MAPRIVTSPAGPAPPQAAVLRRGAGHGDVEYDALEDEFRALIGEHPELTPADNPLEQVGAELVGELYADARHEVVMLRSGIESLPVEIRTGLLGASDRRAGSPLSLGELKR